jgi:GNAT superfamily N-acetyltransferase
LPTYECTERMARCQIRVAEEADAAEIAGLTAELGYGVESVVLRDRLSRILARPDQRFLIADVDGRQVGWLHVAIAEFVEAGRFAWIAGLVVAETHRRQGIGRLLMGRAEDWARDQGCSIVRLWSSSSRAAAHRFYERLGYTNIKTQFSFAKSLDAAGQDELRTFVPRVDSDET